ncbi:MAG: reductive dehalogenase [Thermodesulfobacteriota bacterium]|nr:reductive dehalogenase [Thermodesulfobacteriota bacterium]
MNASFSFTIVNVLIFLCVLGLTIQTFIGLAFFISSVLENERRATVFAAVQFAGMATLLIIFLFLVGRGFFKTSPGMELLIAGFILVILAAIFMVRKTAPNRRALLGATGYVVSKSSRFDERMMVFARNRSIRPDSEQYDRFYSEHPQLEKYDSDRREKGGPLGKIGQIDSPYEGPNVAALLASISMPIHLCSSEIVKPHAHPWLNGNKIDLSPSEATTRIKGYATNLGADLVGIAKINPLWIYSHRGEIFHENWEDWGGKIPADHKYAVVMAHEMSADMIGPAPHTPSLVESMKNYAKGAYLSTQLAAFIANLGYEATANHLRHYTAILPPLAVDAGLGEVGRLGYLITKEFGPRVRLSAVTTNLPLIPDKPVDIGVEDFCKFCKKCATCCPSESIPYAEPTEFNGTLKWKLNDETCFAYWAKAGTDCCICMKVCPWSHARTFPHRLIVRLITRNKYARKIFSVMDDIFYGRISLPKKAPKWARFKK